MPKYNAQGTYQVYLEECAADNVEPLDFKQFKKVLLCHNDTMIEELLKGGTYEFGQGLGRFCIVIFDREFKLNPVGEIINPKCDFGATKKARQESGDNSIIIYHTETTICRWAWLGCSLPMKSSWVIIPTKGPLGISRKIPAYLKKNPDGKSKYVKTNTLKE